VCPADYGYDARVEVTCTGGMVQVGETGPAGLVSISAGQARRCAPVFASWRDRFAEAYAREMAEFVAATDGAPVRVGAEDGTRAVALVLAGTLSMLEERTVSLTEVTSPAFVPSWQAAAQSEA
jgi:predicted dehydrogenase